MRGLNDFEKPQEVSELRSRKTLLAVTSALFISWAMMFIYRASFISIDGQRYFSLFDDALISMRYAWNLSHGFGLVWNPGQYVEGYTNLLMTLLMTLATLLFDKRSAVLAMQVAGIAIILINAYVVMEVATYLTSDRLSLYLKRVLIYLAYLCALLYYPLLFWSLMGMETCLLALLISLGVLGALKYQAGLRLTQALWISMVLGLAYLTRPDSVVSSVLIIGYVVWNLSHAHLLREKMRHLVILLAVYALFPIGQSIFRWLYYGDIVPNTYTLKLVGTPLTSRLANGIGFVEPFIISILPVMVVVIIGLIVDFRRLKLLVVGLLFAQMGYQIGVGGDPWDYWRMMAPVLPLILAVFVRDILVLASWIYNAISMRFSFRMVSWASGLLGGLMIVFALWSLNAGFLSELFLIDRPYFTGSNRVQVNTAIMLNQFTSNDATVGVFWAGSIPYYTGRPAADFLGKADAYIAHLPPDFTGAISWNRMSSVPGHNKYDLDYSIKILQPTYIQGFAWGSQNLAEWVAGRYVSVECGEVELLLLKNAPSVLWDKLSQLENICHAQSQ